MTIWCHSLRIWCGARRSRLIKSVRLSLTSAGGHVLLAGAARIGELVLSGGIFESLGMRKGRRMNTSRCPARRSIEAVAGPGRPVQLGGEDVILEFSRPVGGRRISRSHRRMILVKRFARRFRLRLGRPLGSGSLRPEGCCMFPETAKEGPGQPSPGALSTSAFTPLEIGHQGLEVGIALLPQTHGVDTRALSEIMRPNVLLDRSVLG